MEKLSMKGKKFRAAAAFLAVLLVVGLSPVFSESKVYANKFNPFHVTGKGPGTGKG